MCKSAYKTNGKVFMVLQKMKKSIKSIRTLYFSKNCQKVIKLIIKMLCEEDLAGRKSL